MFPGPGAQIFRNEAGEVLGWDYPAEPDYDPADYLDDRDVEDMAEEFPLRVIIVVDNDEELEIFNAACSTKDFQPGQPLLAEMVTVVREAEENWRAAQGDNDDD